MSKFNNFKNYNPDILETIANLSNDEVFTPPKLANDILDLLPKEIWKDSTITFLDPAVKTGIFLREITSRLIDGLADQIPDLQERVNHILTKQVFGIGITELTTLMARRTLYCSMYANGDKSICTEFDNPDGNIVFPQTEHTWDKNGRCEYCGASEKNYDVSGNKENYAYPFIHDNFEKEFGNMKFDVIIGNPPYQMSDGGGSDTSAVPLYNKFIEKSKELKPKYITMIIPSRWMKGGRGLSKFRKEMISENKIKNIYDFEDSGDCFPGIRVDGGICYFIWEHDYNGKVNYSYKDLNGHVDNSFRYLKNNFTETIIRDSRQESIIKKVFDMTSTYFSNLVSLSNSFGLRSYLFNEPHRYPNVKIYDNKENETLLSVHGVEGKGGSRRVTKYIDRKDIKKGFKSIDTYKLYFSKAYGTEATIPPKIIMGYPGDIATETFLKIGDFNDDNEMNNCISYIQTKFFRALLQYNRHSLNVTSNTFSLIPLQDFSKPWTDEELYKKYKLTQEEIDYIEDNIAPMPTSED